ADALEVGDGLDDGDYDPQVAGSGRAGSKDAAAFLVDGDFHVVDLVVVHGDRLTQRAVALDERSDGLMKLLLHKPAHAQHLTANAFEVFVETAGDVVAKVRGFHQLASPVPLALRARMRAMITEPRRTASVARRACGIGSRPARNCAVAASQVNAVARCAQTLRSSCRAERTATERSS